MGEVGLPKSGGGKICGREGKTFSKIWMPKGRYFKPGDPFFFPNITLGKNFFNSGGVFKNLSGENPPETLLSEKF